MTHAQTATLSRTRSPECSECGRPFTPTRAWSRFCGASCRAEHWRRQRAQKQSPPSPGRPAGEMRQQEHLSGTHPSTLRPGTKLHAIAMALCRGERLDCFMAVRRFHDYVLRSTISEIEHRHGVRIDRRPKTVPGATGKPIHCVEYSANEKAAEKLAELLGGLDGESQRRATP
jgi:hypothetical protein